MSGVDEPSDLHESTSGSDRIDDFTMRSRSIFPPSNVSDLSPS
jgi:hypothetical protein